VERKLYGAIASSQDPTQVANKVKGIILFCSAIIIFIAQQWFHITLTANDVLSLATEMGAIAGALWAIYGSILHLVTWFGTVKSQ
jgi:hypothetical protein